MCVKPALVGRFENNRQFSILGFEDDYRFAQQTIRFKLHLCGLFTQITFAPVVAECPDMNRKGLRTRLSYR